MFETFVVKRV